MLADLRSQEIQRLNCCAASGRRRSTASPGDVSDAARFRKAWNRMSSLMGVSRITWRLRLGLHLISIENGHYGLCEECAEEIAFERLRALPTALCCVDCQGRVRRPRSCGKGRQVVAESEETLADTAARADSSRSAKIAEISEAGQHRERARMPRS